MAPLARSGERGVKMRGEHRPDRFALARADVAPAESAQGDATRDAEIENLAEHRQGGELGRRRVGRRAGRRRPDGAEPFVHRRERLGVDALESFRRLEHLAHDEAGDRLRLRAIHDLPALADRTPGRQRPPQRLGEGATSPNPFLIKRLKLKNLFHGWCMSFL